MISMPWLPPLKQRLFGWHSDGTQPLRLGRRRIFILPSRGGLLYALTLAVMLLGAINYNLALGHALVFLLAGLGLIGMIHSFRNLHGLRITPGRCPPVFTGDAAQFELQLDSEGPNTRYGLVFQAQGEVALTIAVNAGQTAKIDIPVVTQQRGWLELPRIHLSTRYPLGLFTAWAYLQPAMRCLVYPRPLYSPLPESQHAVEGSAAGDAGQEDFAGFRERQPADSLRHVAWKASARDQGHRPLLIKQFAGGNDAQLDLDWSLTDPLLDIEQRLSMLTGWVIEASQAQRSYRLNLPGQMIGPATGPAHLAECLEALALFRP